MATAYIDVDILDLDSTVDVSAWLDYEVFVAVPYVPKSRYDPEARVWERVE